MAGQPKLADNTPWWLPDVTVGGAGSGVIVGRCEMYGAGDLGPKHLEGGFYSADRVGEHVWYCRARADVRVTAVCQCGHPSSRPVGVCNGHLAMWKKRGSQICPRCVHPPEEMALREAMESVRLAGTKAVLNAPDATTRVQIDQKVRARLWDIQEQINELYMRGVIHRCGLTISEVS